MLENITARKRVKIATSSQQFLSFTRNPSYERHVIINDSICIVIFAQETTRLIRPYYVGFTILEYAKNIMYDFFYNVLRPQFGDKNVDLIYSDTDSLCLLIRSNFIIDELNSMKENFDFSNLHPQHPLFSNRNKAKLFKFKEEFGLQPISQICALKSKTYSIEVSCTCKKGISNDGYCIECKNQSNNSSFFTNKLKGVNKLATREILFQNYLDCLLKNSTKKSILYQIRSKKQQLTTTRASKLSLSSFDDKRFLLNCGIHSTPYLISNISQSPYCFICKV